MRKFKLLTIAIILSCSVVTSGCGSIDTSEEMPIPEKSEKEQKTQEQAITVSTQERTQTEKRETPTGSNSTKAKTESEFTQLLKSNEINFTTLNTPYNGEGYDILGVSVPDSNVTNSVNVTHVEKESYRDVSNSDTRYRVEIAVENLEQYHESVKAILLVYSHVLRQSMAEDEPVQFDEVDLIIYNSTSGEKAARNKIQETVVLNYANSDWSLELLHSQIMYTTEDYVDEDFENKPPAQLKKELKENQPDNITITRVEYYGDSYFVDYQTTTPADDNEQRLAEMHKIAKIFGKSGVNELSDRPGDLRLIEWGVDGNESEDLRGWMVVRRDLAEDIATDRVSTGRGLERLSEAYVAEADRLNK